MNIICLLQGAGPFEAGIRRCLGAALDGVTVEYCDDLVCLLGRLRKKACYSDTVVLVETDAKTLGELVKQKELFSDVSLVLLVPDENKSTLAQGHLLRPRFITSSGGDPCLLKEILQNVLRRQRLENQIEALR